MIFTKIIKRNIFYTKLNKTRNIDCQLLIIRKYPSLVKTKNDLKVIERKVIQSNKRNEILMEKKLEKDESRYKIQDFLIEKSWRNLLKFEFKQEYFIKLDKYLKERYAETTVFPSKELIFDAFNYTSFDNVKVVIIGQDPYHNPGQADGLAFSVPKGVKPTRSLVNIFTECENDLQYFNRIENYGYLGSWAEQGVLLLNSFLTVEAFNALSHSKIGWEIFTDTVIHLISEKKSNCVFFLWGNFARAKRNLINSEKHLIIESTHPSPYSADKTFTPFLGSHCFSKSNNYLKSFGKKEINWSLK